MTTLTAAILSSDPTTLVSDGGERLSCLYVVIEGRTDPRVVDFLASCHAGCDASDLDWQVVSRPRSVLVGIEFAHTCGDPSYADRKLRLVFDLERDADALQHLAATEAVVVGTRPYGSFANTVGAFGVDGGAVRRTMAAAGRESSHLAAVARSA